MAIDRRLASSSMIVCVASTLASAQLVASQPLRSDEAEAGLAPIPAAALHASSGRWQFRRAWAPRGSSEVGVTAVATRAGAVAIGDGDGASLRVGDQPFRRVVRSKLVSDLHFDSDGGLWIAALDGLQYLGSDGRVSRPSVGTGELARAATRVQEDAGVVAVATGAGLFLAEARQQRFTRVGSLPAAAVTALALRRDPSDDALPGLRSRVEIWAVSAGFPWRLSVSPGDATLELADARRVSIPGRPGGSAPVDLALGLPGAHVVVVFPQALALGDSADGPWQIVRPVVPPGATLRRVAGFAERVWLATDRGVLEADSLAGPYRRSGPPAGGAASFAFAADSGSLLVASRIGLLEGRPAELAGLETHHSERAHALRHSPRRQPRRGPEILSVQRAALRYLQLGTDRFRQLRWGLDRRGWLPELNLRLGYARDYDDREDWDQTYTSGDTRNLYDYQRDRHRDIAATVELSWELGDTLYNPEAIELSREARQRIALRDDALDEINQLYFERLSVLAQLDALPETVDPLEAERLSLRARELAAGLDGWTGGWFSAALAAQPP